ncbi:uncharacterized protein LOC130917316 isoform X2 [Corythoichthys intestinalis]|uniref:uncharacterized protein LOC130917316 isoform X2 n=1 Tax=Corythoichthys intestinalis TaxID=161448 RepID=UPI0025A65EC1|nr:uncharacterized protein LOC130917316 isoform X2 [Corythoichthys intestinalis]
MAEDKKDIIQPAEQSSAGLFVQDENKEQHSEAQAVGEETLLSSMFTDSTHPEVPRRSQRARTLTEKGKSLQEAKFIDLVKDFERIYKKWKYQINSFKRMLKYKDTDLLPEAVSAISAIRTEICEIYDKFRSRDEIPDFEIRRKCDMCWSITEAARAKAQCLLEEKGDPDSIAWPDSESVFEGSSSSVSSILTHKSKSMSGMSQQSSVVSLQQRQAAAEVAASEEVIKIMKTQHQCEEEIRELEVEDAKRRAQFLTESTTIKTKLEEKKKEVELLKEIQKHNAAQARLRVYAESLNIAALTSQQFAPQQAAVHQPAMTTATSIDLVQTLAEAITANRIPIPEPAIFTGDPLQFNDWKLSFQTLVDRKNIPTQEKLFFLRKYVGGSAKMAIEGHFLVGTDAAYSAAWEILNDRFGDPFVIGKSYRDKIQSWHKIGTKDSKDLRQFADFLTSVESAMLCIKNLQVLNDCVENQRIAAKLPDWLSARWNRKATEFQDEHKMFPDFSYFVKFLNKEARIACNPITSLQAMKPSEPDKYMFKEKPRGNKMLNAKSLSTSSNEKPNITCLFCKKPGHTIHKCRKILEKSVEERVKFVQSEKLCFGCLKSGHNSKNCTSRSVCDKCQKPHPTCLHQDREKRDKEQRPKNDQVRSTSNQETVSEEQESTQVTSNRVVQQRSQGCTSSVIPVYVSTVDEPKNERLVYALLDTQSDTTFILKDTAETLNTKSEPVKLKISTMTSKTKIVSSHKMKDLQVRGMNSETRIKLPTTYTRNYIPANRSHIPTSKTAENWSHLKHLASEMAPKLDCDVGLLIGYNCPQALLPLEVISGERDQPFALKSLLGWCIIGYSDTESAYVDEIGVSHRVIVKQVIPAIEPSCKLKPEVHFVNRNKVKEVTPAQIIKVLEMDFVERSIEEESMSQEDMLFLTKVREGIKQKQDGHFEMPLPFKKEKPELPNNKICAEHRLKCLERRLRKDERYYKDYVAFMQDIIQKGDAEKVPEAELHNQPAWYIPHHGIYHPQKPHKIRVVFDASAKFQNTSLNEHLLSGPDLTNTLVGVLCRFRKGQVAIMCDIERMFHQFHVATQDQDYLRFLWWEDGNMEKPPAVFRMRVHLFGAASSPGCANFGLKHLADQGKSKFSQATVKFIQHNFYVDDGLLSVNLEEEALQIVREARELCDTAKLHLHKFISNCEKVIAIIPKEECAEGATELDLALGEPKMERALGVHWCVTSDIFCFRVVMKNNPFTRRGVLSTVASIFDPLGFVAPFILVGKRILQRMCQEKLDWDEPLPQDLKPEWEAWLRDLQNLSTIKISRCYVPSTFNQVQQYELHSFSDASVSGYGVCSYLRTVTKSGEVHCTLVMGKARVAPTKVTTIPRLELSAAVVATRTASFLKRELEIPDIQEYYWTDSKVVLGYINNDARRFHVFVANRIQQIRSSTEPSQWRYVASELNPADHASRGIMTRELVESNWFTGPCFLWQKELPKDDVKLKEINTEDPELKVMHVFTVQAKEEKYVTERLQKFSDWTRAVKAIARLRRYVKSAKNSKVMSNESTTLEERKEAEEFIIRTIQKETFSKEIQSLKDKEELKSFQSKLYQLSPFLDMHDILRVGGRLTKASLHPNIKHPVIMPRDHHVSRLLIKHCHEKIHHQGRGMTVNEIRANGIWIIGCSTEVSSFIYKCVKCRRYRKYNQEQKMGDLPSERLEATPPFACSGMDCFGPFCVKEGRKEVKRYGLLFTCMCSRAIHIEVLDDLSTDCFLNALRCFIAIRGNVSQLHCDQGTNFIGARNELLTQATQEKVKSLGISFVFNPPASSHMGGVWERQIRTIRNVLRAILDESASRLDTSSLRTFMYETMAIVNSRPLTVECLNDPVGPEPLTPNHILTMKSTVITPPPGEFVKEDLYLQKRWKRLQYLANVFWTRWRKEYLLNLQQRLKWSKNRRNMKIDDIVLLQEDCVPRNQWKLAKVVEVTPGADGRVRKVKLLIGDSKTVLERPIHKTVLLLEAG